MSKEELNVLTIGHSTRTLEEFIEILEVNSITLVVDVRTIPHSRHNPQFNKEAMPANLKPCGIAYIHIPDIGGFRRPKPNSVNSAWANAGFRGYADYMQTKEFTENLLKIIALARENRLVLMCAEALPWRCHRSLISDALIVRHIRVGHIISKTSIIKHKLNESAYVEGTKITYPLYTKKNPQRSLSDFGSHFEPKNK